MQLVRNTLAVLDFKKHLMISFNDLVIARCVMQNWQIISSFDLFCYYNILPNMRNLENISHISLDTV